MYLVVFILQCLFRTAGPEEKAEVDVMNMTDFLKFFHFEKRGTSILRSRMTDTDTDRPKAFRFKREKLKIKRVKREIKEEKHKEDDMDTLISTINTDIASLQRSSSI